MWASITLILNALGSLGSIKREASTWCQAAAGTCVGELHSFEHRRLPGQAGLSGRSSREADAQHLSFADWDADGDLDLLAGHYTPEVFQIDFYERLPDDTYRRKELLKLPHQGFQSFRVADWDVDGKLDLLFCTRVGDETTVTFLNRSLFHWNSETVDHGKAIVSIKKSCSSLCDQMQPVDFDEDGDVDLFLGRTGRGLGTLPPCSAYFERSSADLVQRDVNPMSQFDNAAAYVVQIVDVDGDGRLDVIQERRHSLDYAYRSRLRYFRRSHDGSFVEPVENPLREIDEYVRSIHVTDWNSDGLPDIVMVQTSGNEWKIENYYQHVLNLDMKYNSYFTSYEDIMPGFRRHLAINWNKDGWHDVVLLPDSHNNVEIEAAYISWVEGRSPARPPPLGLYEVNQLNVREVGGVFEDIPAKLQDSFAIVDWDFDGDLDLIVGSYLDHKVYYYEMVLGHLKSVNSTSNPFRHIKLDLPDCYDYLGTSCCDSLMPVDWDNDGDMDLVLGDGRYFEQMADGSLHEWPSEKSPFRAVGVNRTSSFERMFGSRMRFLDSDGDGDLDLIRRVGQRFQACEHDSAGEVRCDDDFQCLGTNLSNSLNTGLSDSQNWDLGDVSDGRLKIITSDNRLKLWTAGFCTPLDACYGKGSCRLRHLKCSCNPGHELDDCSRCEPHFYSVAPDAGQMRNCKPCPGDGNVCYGRGDCFDDATAQQALAEHDKTARVAAGNGSCICHEAYFNGNDADGRSTCLNGSCPAGTEERDGRCHPCDAGAFSSEGGSCKKCPRGRYSLSGNSVCLLCPAGLISDIEGAAVCDPCPAGKYEVNGLSCYDCQPGKMSSGRNSSCSPCQAGFAAPKPGSSTCEACAAGRYSEEASARCVACPLGTVSSPASGTCSRCDAGSFARDSSTCEQCPGGTYSPPGSSACQVCLAGRFSLTGFSSCPKCPAGSITKVEGASTCELCPGGTSARPGSSTCQMCQAGKFSPVGSSSCINCAAGFISQRGASACDQCPLGTQEVNHQYCDQCPAGFAVSLETNFSCTKCQVGFVAPNPGSSACEPCPAGTYEANHLSCSLCAPGFVSLGANNSCSACQAGFVAPDPGSDTCQPCPGGTYSISAGRSTCPSCPPGQVSSPGSAVCDPCEGSILRTTPDVTKQSCQIDEMDVVLAVISTVTSACFCFLCLIGLHGRVAVADLSAQGQKLVITTSISHFLLKQSFAEVTFTGSGVPDLETFSWKVKALNSFQLTLHGESSGVPLDTSMGHVHMKFPRVFLVIGLWHCPLIGWCLLFGAASTGTASQLKWSSSLLVVGLGTLAGSLAFFWRRRQSRRTPLWKRRRQFLQEWPLRLKPCERGPDRSITAGELQDFAQFFEAFIKERSMYYVCSNLVKPLTEPYQLSFVELVGPSPMEWFVSHYWGMAARHFNDAIRKHAQSYASDWRALAFWICTFSNSQWHVKDELGNGVWQESSFYLALRSPACRGTAMIIDEQVLPLQRIWCLFEVYHTIRLSCSSDHFQGLLLCTSTGVLQEGRAGTDVAVRVAERAADLDTRSAEATCEEDRQMICDLIEAMPGGFDAMNNYVRETILEALEASHQHYESTFKGLIRNLTSRVAFARAANDATSLPRLLGAARAVPSDQTAEKTQLAEGQESPRDDVAI